MPHPLQMQCSSHRRHLVSHAADILLSCYRPPCRGYSVVGSDAYTAPPIRSPPPPRPALLLLLPPGDRKPRAQMNDQGGGFLCHLRYCCCRCVTLRCNYQPRPRRCVLKWHGQQSFRRTPTLPAPARNKNSPRPHQGWTSPRSCS